MKAWKGVDTVIVSAGVSAIQPLLSLAGLENPRSRTSTAQASAENIHHVVDVVSTVSKINFIGPLVAAVAFVSFQSVSADVCL